MPLKRSLISIFANPYTHKEQELEDKTKSELAFYRPVFFNLASKYEMEHMDSKEIAEINELALQLEEEQAIVIANKLGEVVSRLFGNDKQ